MRYDRITIWGNSGSGKSTLSTIAGHTLDLPVFHLDLIAWEQDWRFRNEPDFLALQRHWVEQPHWIIEGVGCWAGLVERFRHSDLIIHLDTPVVLCEERARRRMAEDQVTKNRFMAEGCRYSDVTQRQMEVIRHFEDKLRGEIEALLQTEFAAKAQDRIDGTQSPEALCRALLTRVSGV